MVNHRTYRIHGARKAKRFISPDPYWSLLIVKGKLPSTWDRRFVNWVHLLVKDKNDILVLLLDDLVSYELVINVKSLLFRRCWASISSWAVFGVIGAVAGRIVTKKKSNYQDFNMTIRITSNDFY